MLSIEVIDDGQGFKEEDLKQALNPFYTSSKSETNHYGMGLAICKILCGNHGERFQLKTHAVWVQRSGFLLCWKSR